jgi:SAM-dependent methyltransferase
MFNRKKITIDAVRKSYSGKGIIQIYEKHTLDIGLWKSEQIMALKYWGENFRILDIGCGPGRTTFGLYRLGWHSITGLDLSQEMIKKADLLAKKLGYPISFLCGNALALPFDTGSFDGALFSFNGIMQIPGKEDRIQAMAEIQRVLKPGGIFIFTTHNDRGKNEWKAYWEEETEKWKNNKQDRRLLEFGDRMIHQDGFELFLHFPMQEEVLECIDRAGFKLLENSLRSDICTESEAVKKVSNENRFWVVRK